MKRTFLVLAVLSVGFPAHAGSPNLPSTLAQWQSLRDPDAPGVAFADGVRFLADHPGWPDEKTIRIRTEAAADFEHPNAAVMADFCRDPGPISGHGMFACLRAKAGDEPQRQTWLHQGWIQGDFSDSEERLLLAEHDFTSADHIARIERLLYEKKTAAAKRMLPLVPAARRPLYLARIALIGDDRHAKTLLRNLPTAEQHNPGILFDRITNAMGDHDADEVVTLISAAPANAPYPDLWWPARNMAIREALARRNSALAFSMLARRGEIKGEALAEALWLKGWIALEFRHDPRNAYKDFHRLYTEVATPVSRARAAYWAARAAHKNGNTDIAHEWLEKAARYTTVFYGQLAALTLSPGAPLPLPTSPHATAEDRHAFEQDEQVEAIRLLSANRDEKMRDRFLSHLANTSSDPARLVLLADLARQLDGVSGGVKLAKLALRKQVVMIDYGWPRITLPHTLGVEPALALAISRQESEFDIHAQSAADARGLMQLLPATARHIAERNDISYSDSLLERADSNLTLGTFYLGQIIHGFDGSYVLGIASYNAGPATVRRWTHDQGPPPKTLDGTIDWIESIPFAETRNYVMRVLENTQVYRTLLTPEAPLKLSEDILR